MTKEQILSEINAVDTLTRKLLAARPNDPDLHTTEVILQRARDMVNVHWPLTPEDLKNNNLAMFSFRVLEGGPYEDLPDKLLELSAHLNRP